MKKIRKIVYITIISIFLLGTTTQINFAASHNTWSSPEVQNQANDISTIIKHIDDNGDEIPIEDEVYDVAGTIINWIWWISIILSVIALMLIGLKYMTGSVADKSASKKSLTILTIGVILVVFATSMVKILFNAFN